MTTFIYDEVGRVTPEMFRALASLRPGHYGPEVLNWHHVVKPNYRDDHEHPFYYEMRRNEQGVWVAR